METNKLTLEDFIFCRRSNMDERWEKSATHLSVFDTTLKIPHMNTHLAIWRYSWCRARRSSRVGQFWRGNSEDGSNECRERRELDDDDYDTPNVDPDAD